MKSIEKILRVFAAFLTFVYHLFLLQYFSPRIKLMNMSTFISTNMFLTCHNFPLLVQHRNDRHLVLNPSPLPSIVLSRELLSLHSLRCLRHFDGLPTLHARGSGHDTLSLRFQALLSRLWRRTEQAIVEICQCDARFVCSLPLPSSRGCADESSFA